MITNLVVTIQGRVIATGISNGKPIRLDSNMAPSLSFQYDTFKYLDNRQTYTVGDVEFNMDESQKAEIREIMRDIKEDKELTQNLSENIKALNYLKSTDWYITRKVEIGKEVPQDILDKRKLARESIHDL